jgi:putative DNA methylase
LLSDEPIPEDHVKAEAVAGRMGSSPLAVVAEGRNCRVYLPPEVVKQVTVRRSADLRGIDAPLGDDPRNLWCLGYGLDTFDKLFTNRQLTALATFSDLVSEAREKVRGDAIRAGLPADEKPLADGGPGASAYADAFATYLGLGIIGAPTSGAPCVPGPINRRTSW